MSLAVAVEKRAVAIDDSRTVLASVRHALEQLGFQVTTATDPAQLVPEQLQEAHLIVVDVNMEEVFGDDVVSFLRESWQVRAPIFLYSSLPISELEKRAKGAGADGAVCKGDGVGALVARVRHLAGGA